MILMMFYHLIDDIDDADDIDDIPSFICEMIMLVK
jgi:hypothetical protein